MSDSTATKMQHAFGFCNLLRWSPDPTRSLQAWDAADLYLLSLLKEESLKLDEAEVLLLNDEFGALTTALATSLATTQRPAQATADQADSKLPGSKLHCVEDSFVGRRAAKRNLETNAVHVSPTIAAGIVQDDRTYNLVLIKIPKSSALLSDQLHRLRAVIHADTQVFCAGMDKHLSPNVQKTIERLLGPAERLLARKKARAFRVRPDLALNPGHNPHPASVELGSLTAPLLVHSAVFSQRKLDPGSAMLLKHLPGLSPGCRIVDLGCGSGVLGLHCLAKEPTAQVLFVDESSAAIESTRANLAKLFPQSESVCLNQDCLDPPPGHPIDLIVCNPPFHANRNVLTATAERMFQQSQQVLAVGGKLVIVGNRHLDYPRRLLRIFGQSTVLAQDNRYQVVSARRR